MVKSVEEASAAATNVMFTSAEVHRREPHALLDVVPIRGDIEPVADLATRIPEGESVVSPHLKASETVGSYVAGSDAPAALQEP
jgi:hypothetical protein